MRNLTLILTFISLMLFSTLPNSSFDTHRALPTNDLWMEDYYEKSSGGEEMFNKIIDIAYEIYLPISEEFGDKSLTINKRWGDSTVNANCSRMYGEVTINMFGGLARRPEVTPEGFALVLCHELGHAYGGAPLITSWRNMSVEGQADYYGAKKCLELVLQKLNLEDYEVPPTPFMETSCEDSYGYDSRSKRCVRTLTAGQSLASLLALLSKVDVPDYETPDLTEVEITARSYPDTVQCRLDTYYRGALGTSRPACWFKSE